MYDHEKKSVNDTFSIRKITDDILDGKRLCEEDDISFLKEGELSVLMENADRIRETLVGDTVDLCTIINGKGGNCGEDCKFCAQSAHSHTNCDIHKLLPYEAIIKEAKSNEEEGVNRFAIVTAGRSPLDEDFEKLLEYYSKMKQELNISLCASLGFLTAEQFERLHAAGVSSYHNNIETSRRFFSEICTTHSFDDKIANIKRAQAAGLSVCSGGIIGMGETMDDRIDMAFTLSSLGIKSIPINALIPIPGTPLETLPRLTEDEILRTIAIFRFINPEADIRLAAGRRLMTETGINAFRGGASATITGNMLTTTGSTIKSDRAMLTKLGRTII